MYNVYGGVVYVVHGITLCMDGVTGDVFLQWYGLFQWCGTGAILVCCGGDSNIGYGVDTWYDSACVQCVVWVVHV